MHHELKELAWLLAFWKMAIGNDSGLIYHKNYFVQEHSILCSEFCSWQRNTSCSWLDPGAHLEGVVTKMYVLESVSPVLRVFFFLKHPISLRGTNVFSTKAASASLLAARVSACLLVTVWLVISQGPRGGLALAVRTEQTILAETRTKSVHCSHRPGLQLCFSVPCQNRYNIKHWDAAKPSRKTDSQ